jgi:hypothetical protein
MQSHACRKSAAADVGEEFDTRFTDRVMAKRYLDVYQRLLAHRGPANVDIDKVSNVDQPFNA